MSFLQKCTLKKQVYKKFIELRKKSYFFHIFILRKIKFLYRNKNPPCFQNIAKQGGILITQVKNPLNFTRVLGWFFDMMPGGHFPGNTDKFHDFYVPVSVEFLGTFPPPFVSQRSKPRGRGVKLPTPRNFGQKEAKQGGLLENP